MQLYFITRGHKHWVDEFIRNLEGKWFPIQIDGKPLSWQGSVRPIQLWEYAFPKEYYDIVCQTLFDGDQKFGATAYPLEKTNLFSAALRIPLRAKKLKPYKTDQAMPVIKMHMSILGLGYRDDKDNINPDGSVSSEGV